MADKTTKASANSTSMLKLLNEDEVQVELGEAFASFMLNPAITWAKFVLTDDKKNANGERVPKTEFPNLIRTGVNMPVKMAIGEISEGHPGTKPLGTITHLKEMDMEAGGSAIVAIAALWGKERPADVEFLKKRFSERQPVDVSWEILYEDAQFNPETESMDLIGTVLGAATIVGNPAYEGRTPFLSIAAKKISEATLEPNEDNNSEEELNEIEQLKADLAEAQRKLDEAKAQLTEKETALAEKEAEVARLTEESNAKETELVPLREFKASADAEKAKEEKLANVKSKFVEAGIEKDDEYFSSNEEALLKMDDDMLSFHLQDLKAFAESSKTSTASKKTTKIPPLAGTDAEELSPKNLGQALRQNRGKK